MSRKAIEQKLKNLKFKKKWLGDKSGYWFERHYKVEDLGLECKFYIEPEKNLMINTAKVGTLIGNKITAKQFDDFKSSKINFKYISKILKKYGK